MTKVVVEGGLAGGIDAGHVDTRGRTTAAKGTVGAVALGWSMAGGG